MSKYQALIDALALEPQAWSHDSNQTPFYNDPEGNSRGGDCDGTYRLFGEDFEIDGETYEGPTLSERCSKADANYIAAANPATIRALLADLERAEKALREVVAVFDSNPSSICDTVWVAGNRPETLYDHCQDALAQMAGGG